MTADVDVVDGPEVQIERRCLEVGGDSAITGETVHEALIDKEDYLITTTKQIRKIRSRSRLEHPSLNNGRAHPMIRAMLWVRVQETA